MSQTLAPAGPPTEDDLALAGPPPRTERVRRGGALLGLSMHAIMLFAAVAGIAYTDARAPEFKVIWVALAPLYGLICIVDGWRYARSARARGRLVVTQVLHWATFVGAMYLVFRPEVAGVLNDDSEGLTVLSLLALGTFLAGVHAWSWRVCAVGLFLGAAVPAIAWVDQTGLLVLVAGLTVVVLVLISWLAYRWEARRLRG